MLHDLRLPFTHSPVSDKNEKLKVSIYKALFIYAKGFRIDKNQLKLV